MGYLIYNATIVNERRTFRGGVVIEGDRIQKIFEGDVPEEAKAGCTLIDASGKLLIPGAIDDQVHFREPGLTHKAEIYTEAKAAVAGGITSYMEMPNTIPNVLTQDLLEDKYRLAAEKSLANYSFYMGVSNDNLGEVIKTDASRVCGVKVFMGSSTGNMLVDDQHTLEKLFAECPTLLAAHCEDEQTIRDNLAEAVKQYGDDIPMAQHPVIRSAEACYKSSSLGAELAEKYGTRFHILHISTAKELALFDNNKPLAAKKITAEACIHHLWFCDSDYEEKQTFIKWNPAVKTARDRDALLQGVLDNKIDVIATDHAPHTREEKLNPYTKAPSGGPLVQHALTAMLEHYHNGKISLEKIVEKMCHAPAVCFQVKDRGFIREGYKADLVLVDTDTSREVNAANILYKCGWSPFEGQTFRSAVTHTFVNGHLVYDNGTFDESQKGERLLFDR